MASASSTSAKNLFSDSRRRLCERAVASVHSLGSVSRQVARGSRQHDILTNSAKQLCQTESAMENSFNNLQRMQVRNAEELLDQTVFYRWIDVLNVVCVVSTNVHTLGCNEYDVHIPYTHAKLAAKKATAFLKH